MFRSLALFTTLSLFGFAMPASAQDASSLTLEVPLYASKTKKGTTFYKPFKFRKGSATVTVRFYDGQPGPESSPLHTSQVVITANNVGAAFDVDDQPQPSVVVASAPVLLDDLPSDLLTRDLWFTTQTDYSKFSWAESPARPVGLGGLTEGRDLNPNSVTIGDGGLSLPAGASNGAVLTTDASGNATWQQLSVDGVADGAVTSAKIEDGTIQAVDVATGALTGSEIQDGSLGAADLGTNSVGASEIAAGAVGSSEIADGSVTADDLGTNSVGASEIAAGAVGSSEIANGSITSDDLALGAVGSAQVADGSLTAADLADNSVGASEIAAGAVGSSEVVDNSLGAIDLAENSVGPSELDQSDQHNWAFKTFPVGFIDYRLRLVEDGGYGVALTYSDVDYANSLTFSATRDDGDLDFFFTTNGDLVLDGSLSQADGFAQMLEVGEEEEGEDELEVGHVLVIDPHRPRSVVRSSGARSTLVAGLYAPDAGLIGSHREWDEPLPMGDLDHQVLLDQVAGHVQVAGRPLGLQDLRERYSEIPVGMSGIVHCRVSAENGAIQPGDLLVTAWTPGHAMRDPAPGVGTVLGKALESLPSGTGLIEIIVTLD